MISIKFDIQFKSEDDKKFVLERQKQYSYAFKKLYVHFDKISDKDYLNMLRKRFNLSAYDIQCLIIDVKTKFNQVSTQKRKLEESIVECQVEIEKLQDKENRTRKETRKLFKLTQKLEYKNKRLPKDITFGGLANLQKISYLSNAKETNFKELELVNQRYQMDRILPLNHIGETLCPNSNRNFIFDFINNSIIYKPGTFNERAEIFYKISKGYRKYLLQLEKIKNSKIQPISAKLTSTYLVLTFDEQRLNGFSFNKKLFLEDRTKTDDAELRKQIFIKHKREQEARQLIGKLPNRYCGIDLNPEYIGVAILDKILNTDEFKVIDKFCFDLSILLQKTGKSSDNQESKAVVNKRKFEICNIYTDLFKILKHYNVSYFVIENLNFKPKLINEASKEANRKTENVWNLGLQKHLITKHCNISGIQLLEVNPCYSSFIGNITYNYFDPTNAAIEICRRGLNKYKKNNSFYPKLTDTIIDTMVVRFPDLDVQEVKGCKTWVKLFNLAKETGLKYRWQLEDTKFSRFRKNSIKSKVYLYIFE